MRKRERSKKKENIVEREQGAYIRGSEYVLVHKLKFEDEI